MLVWVLPFQAQGRSSCMPIPTLRFSCYELGPSFVKMTPKFLSSCHPVGQPDSMTISYLITLFVTRVKSAYGVCNQCLKPKCNELLSILLPKSTCAATTWPRKSRRTHSSLKHLIWHSMGLGTHTLGRR